MDAYLEIATVVLRTEKRPLSSRAILAEAHRAGLVPTNLHGKRQHKTLGARISEDIVDKRDQSLFFRTEPGRFFLREFINDESLPSEYRKPYPARRRIRELARGPALAINRDILRSVIRPGKSTAAADILALICRDSSRYINPKDRMSDSTLVRSFVCVCKGSKILTYRLGRYRDDRDTFMHKRSIGFATLVNLDAHTLFNVDDLGIVEAGVNAVKIDLDIPHATEENGGDLWEATLHTFLWVNRAAGADDLLAVVSYRCPAWFEPARRRLALNDLEWVDPTGLNNIDDYDPWSRSVLEEHRSLNIFPDAPFE